MRNSQWLTDRAYTWYSLLEIRLSVWLGAPHLVVQHQILLFWRNLTLAKLGRTRQYPVRTWMHMWGGFTWRLCIAAIQWPNVLVDVWLHGMLEDYKNLENMWFSSFSRLMEVGRHTNESVTKTLRSHSLLRCCFCVSLLERRGRWLWSMRKARELRLPNTKEVSMA